MKILFLGDFRFDSPHALLTNTRKLSKGLIRNGHDVLSFSYRNMMLQLSPLKKKKWAVKLAKKKTDQMLVDLTRHYRPDLVFIAAFKPFNAETILKMKEVAKGAIFMCWYADPCRGYDPKVAAFANLCDWFLSSSAGEVLRVYKEAGVPHCAFLPNCCDADVEKSYPDSNKWRSQILFTGTLKHGKVPGQDPLREELLSYLVKNKGLTIWSDMGKPTLKGQDYLEAICQTDMAIHINAYNDVRFYHSDRLIQYLGCGAFVLSKYVPGSEIFFENNKHLCYFDTLQECLELIDRYKDNAAERKRMGEAGMKRAHEAFSCEKIASHIVDLATKGSYDAAWSDIV